MPVRTAVITHSEFHGIVPPAGIDVFTVPAGHVYLARDFSVMNLGALHMTCDLQHERGASQISFADIATINSLSSAQVTGRYITFEAGDKLRVAVITGTDFGIVVFGADLIL